MKQLIKNECRRWFTRKKICAFLCLMGCCVLFYEFYYHQSYLSYYEKEYVNLKNEYTDVSSVMRIYGMNMKIDDSEDLKIAYDIYDKEYQLLAKEMNLWNNNTDGRFDEELLSLEKQRDENLLRLEENRIEPMNMQIYRNTPEDLNNRIKLRESYEQQHIKEKVVKNVPDVNYVLYKIFSGSDATIFLILFILCIVNFNIWSSEFENQTYRLACIQPYQRKSIYISKLLVQIIMSLGLFFLMIVTLATCAYIQYGVGEPIIVAVNQTMLHGVQTSADQVFTYVTTSSLLIKFLLRQILYISILEIVIHTVSFFAKKTELSLLVIFTLLIAMVFAGLSEHANLINIYQLEKLYSETQYVSQLSTFGMLALIGILCFFINYLYLVYCDLKG